MLFFRSKQWMSSFQMKQSNSIINLSMFRSSSVARSFNRCRFRRRYSLVAIEKCVKTTPCFFHSRLAISFYPFPFGTQFTVNVQWLFLCCCVAVFGLTYVDRIGFFFTVSFVFLFFNKMYIFFCLSIWVSLKSLHLLHKRGANCRKPRKKQQPKLTTNIGHGTWALIWFDLIWFR